MPLFMRDPNQSPLPNFPYKPGATDPPPSIAAPTVPVVPPVPRPAEVDYASMIDKLFASPPDFSAEAKAQLDAIYGPQYASINRKKGEAQASAKTGDAKLEAMYRALQKDIKGNQGAIDKAFNQGKAGVSAAYRSGKGAIDQNYRGANSELAAMMQQLGLQAAAPEVLSENTQQQALLKSLLDATNQSAVSGLNQSQQASSNFNTAQGNIAGYEGTERRADLQEQLRARLGALDDASLGLQSQYAQQQADFLRQLQGDWTNQQQSQANSLFDQMRWDQQQRMQAENMDYQRVQDAIKAQQMGAGGLSEKDQWSMMGPVERGYSKAAQMLGPDKASQAMNLIMQVGGGRSFSNGFEFAAAVAQANQQAAQANAANALPPDQLQALAATIYKEINPDTPSYLQYLNQ